MSLQQDIYELAERVITEAGRAGLTIATAESCTGGGIGQALTAVPGSSRVFLGGAIVYSNSAKEDVLNLPHDICVEHGAVSEPVARILAENATELFNSDIAVSVTGIAGPGGGTELKPVGRVYLGLAVRAKQAQVKRLNLGDIGREAVRQATVLAALSLLDEAI